MMRDTDYGLNTVWSHLICITLDAFLRRLLSNKRPPLKGKFVLDASLYKTPHI